MPSVLSVAILALALQTEAARSQTAPSQPPTTEIMAILTIKPEIARPDMMKVMPEEVRATVQLYLDGKIDQWYARSDGKGVVFLFRCGSVAEAKALMDALPLHKAGFAETEYMALGPLTPLRILAGPTPSAAAPAR